MKTITVRGIDAPLAEKLKKTAKNEGKSVNQLVIDSIKDRLEADLSALCSDFRDELTATDFTISDISDAMPAGSVLLEYVK